MFHHKILLTLHTNFSAELSLSGDLDLVLEVDDHFLLKTRKTMPVPAVTVTLYKPFFPSFTILHTIVSANWM